jgi:hypothetical protein
MVFPFRIVFCKTLTKSVVKPRRKLVGVNQDRSAELDDRDIEVIFMAPKQKFPEPSFREPWAIREKLLNSAEAVRVNHAMSYFGSALDNGPSAARLPFTNSLRRLTSAKIGTR